MIALHLNLTNSRDKMTLGLGTIKRQMEVLDCEI